jgi:hypothetical protein
MRSTRELDANRSHELRRASHEFKASADWEAIPGRFESVGWFMERIRPASVDTRRIHGGLLSIEWELEAGWLTDLLPP